MNGDVFRFQFDTDVPLDEAESSLHLALFAAEGLFGQARVRLDAGYDLDPMSRSLVIDVSTEVGASVARIFTGLLVREFGESAFEVDRDHSVHQHEPQEMCA
jgi:hypothetical protein